MNPNADPAPEAKPSRPEIEKINGTEAWSVADLLRHSSSANSWIIEGLLKKGSQMLFAAPPKTGKSYIAMEIALTLSVPFKPGEIRYLFKAGPPQHPTPKQDSSKGEKEFPWLLVRPPEHGKAWKVLFLSLEMKIDEVSGRLRQQLGRFDLPSYPLSEKDPVPEELEFDLRHVFELANQETGKTKSDLDIVETEVKGYGLPATAKMGADAASLQALITKVAPDVVIYDTLMQLHNVNENDNILMKGVMRALRKLTVREPFENGKIARLEEVAHIVLHHTRKDSGQYRGQLSPEIMRGAGAVHGVADLVMLARQDYEPGVLEVHVSSRSSSIPNFFLRRIDKTASFEWFERKEKDSISKEERAKDFIYELVKNHTSEDGLLFDVNELRKQLNDKKLPYSDKTIQSFFDELCKDKLIHIKSCCKSANVDNELRENAKIKWDWCWFDRGAGGQITIIPKRKGETPMQAAERKKKSPGP